MTNLIGGEPYYCVLSLLFFVYGLYNIKRITYFIKKKLLFIYAESHHDSKRINFIPDKQKKKIHFKRFVIDLENNKFDSLNNI